MANFYGFDITYDRPWDTTVLRSIAVALRSAIEINWSDRGDSPRRLDSGWLQDLDQWIVGATIERMNRVPDALPDETTELFSDSLDLLFSPFSNRTCEVYVARERNGRIMVSLLVSERVKSWDGMVDDRSAEERWPMNQRCLIRVLDALSTVATVDHIRVDEFLR